MEIGSRIRELRKLKGMTAEELGKRINVTQQTISNYENNNSRPDIDTLAALCSVLGVSLAEFFDDEQERLPPDFRRLLMNAKSLTLEELRELNNFLETIGRKRQTEEAVTLDSIIGGFNSYSELLAATSQGVKSDQMYQRQLANGVLTELEKAKDRKRKWRAKYNGKA